MSDGLRATSGDYVDNSASEVNSREYSRGLNYQYGAPVKGEYCVTVFLMKIQDGRRCRVPQQRTKAKAMSTVGGRGCKMATAAFPRQTLPEGYSAQSRPCVVDGAAPSLLP